MSGLIRTSWLQVLDLERPGERGAHPKLLAFGHQVLQGRLVEEVKQVPPILDQRVDEHPIALALLCQFHDQLGVDPVVEMAVGERRGDQLRIEPLESSAALAKDAKRRGVVALDEPDLDGGRTESPGPVDRQRDGAGLVRHDART